MLSDLEEVVSIYFQLPFNTVLKDTKLLKVSSKSAKCDSSVCYYKDTNGKRYGKILGFIKMNTPSAIMRPFKLKTQSYCLLLVQLVETSIRCATTRTF